MATVRKRGRPVGTTKTTESAKKARKRQADQERSKEKVYIGNHLKRWNAVKEELDLTFHHEVAGYLLDRYEALKEAHVVSSTPKAGYPIRVPQAISDISSGESGKPTADLAMSGIEEHESGPRPSTSKRTKGKFASSFLDPFELSIDITEESYDEDEEESEYQPSFNISLGPKDVSGIEDCPGIEYVLLGDDNADDDIEEAETEVEGGPSVTRVLCGDDIKEKMKGNDTAIVYMHQLMNLANMKVQKVCPVEDCGETLNIEVQHVGSAIYLKWICQKSHEVEKWCSQPVFDGGLHAGDLMLSSSILFSGNNFSKMQLFARFMKLAFLGESTFTRIQNRYLVPAVDELWTAKQAGIMKELSGQDLILLAGDGRMDSPGHCAQFCTYTVMDNETKKIISVKTLDKRETEGKSINLEKAGIVRCLEEIQDKGLNVSEIITDAHLQIDAMIKKEHPEVIHRHDVWHAAKNLGKKLIEAGQKESCSDLLKWSKDIVNHFWYVCKTAKNMDEFLGMWVGVLHHVVNEHEWFLPYSETGMCSCVHDPLPDTRDKVWMTKGSPAHEALKKIVLDKHFPNNIHYYLNFRSTAELESYHNYILMYSSEGFLYSPPVYRARSLLAALDYNQNVDRKPLRHKDGTLSLYRTYNKKSGRWMVYPIKQKKNYDHVEMLIDSVLEKGIQDKEGFRKPYESEEGDHRSLSRTIAPVTPPPTVEKWSGFET